MKKTLIAATGWNLLRLFGGKRAAGGGEARDAGPLCVLEIVKRAFCGLWGGIQALNRAAGRGARPIGRPTLLSGLGGVAAAQCSRRAPLSGAC